MNNDNGNGNGLLDRILTAAGILMTGTLAVAAVILILGAVLLILSLPFLRPE